MTSLTLIYNGKAKERLGRTQGPWYGNGMESQKDSQAIGLLSKIVHQQIMLKILQLHVLNVKNAQP